MDENDEEALIRRGAIRVRLTAKGNDYIKKGEEGLMFITERSRYGDVITANFYPCNLYKGDETEPQRHPTGFGEIRNPKFESVSNSACRKR